MKALITLFITLLTASSFAGEGCAIGEGILGKDLTTLNQQEKLELESMISTATINETFEMDPNEAVESGSTLKYGNTDAIIKLVLNVTSDVIAVAKEVHCPIYLSDPMSFISGDKICTNIIKRILEDQHEYQTEDYPSQIQDTYGCLKNQTIFGVHPVNL